MQLRVVEFSLKLCLRPEGMIWALGEGFENLYSVISVTLDVSHRRCQMGNEVYMNSYVLVLATQIEKTNWAAPLFSGKKPRHSCPSPITVTPSATNLSPTRTSDSEIHYINGETSSRTSS